MVHEALWARGYRLSVTDMRDVGCLDTSRVDFRKGNAAERIPWEDDTFDLIVCISTLEHIGEDNYHLPVFEDGPGKAMREMLRILRPGGRLGLCLQPAILRPAGGLSLRGQVPGRTTAIPGDVSDVGDGVRLRGDRHDRGVAGTPASPHRTKRRLQPWRAGMRVTYLTAGLVIALASGAAAQDTAAVRPAAPASNITIEAVLTRNVIDRVPQDTVTAIPAPAAADTLYLWTRVTGADPGTVLHHVWFKGEDQVGDVELTVGGSPWRTWSRKTIPADATGAWRVEVRDAAGNVIQTVQFSVG